MSRSIAKPVGETLLKQSYKRKEKKISNVSGYLYGKCLLHYNNQFAQVED